MKCLRHEWASKWGPCRGPVRRSVFKYEAYVMQCSRFYPGGYPNGAWFYEDLCEIHWPSYPWRDHVRPGDPMYDERLVEAVENQLAFGKNA